ncbi:hypothetical protein PIB30_060147 [Stylosanthes scabra]|uniref:Uncharacterized protein n=1 Tax=Stylosanthes scabra TaxID=79078 RepID=A0ABU6SKF3_9FABA|nr:hypothetical protein [Stylosanthes scabra]
MIQHQEHIYNLSLSICVLQTRGRQNLMATTGVARDKCSQLMASSDPNDSVAAKGRVEDTGPAAEARAACSETKMVELKSGGDDTSTKAMQDEHGTRGEGD